MQLKENPVQIFNQIWAWKLRKTYAEQNDLPILVMQSKLNLSLVSRNQKN